MTTAADSYTMLPYQRMGEIDYDSLEFDAYEPVEKPEAMEQEQPQDQIIGFLFSFFTEFNRRPDVFLSRDTNICYDPSNLNVRVSPDAYLSFGVDARAIRPRLLYLPWEVGKPPDWVLEVASRSTRREDIRNKPGIYARIGVPEYWMFDPTGGRYYGEPIIGMQLSGGVYRPLSTTREPDGILKGYSPVLQLSLAWDDGWPRFYNPATGTYLLNWRESLEAWRRDWESLLNEQTTRLRVTAERDAAEAARQQAKGERDAAEAARQQAKGERDAERNARQQAEGERDAAETARQQAEGERDAAETARQQAEGERDAERNARQQAEAALERLRELLRRRQPPDDS